MIWHRADARCFLSPTFVEQEGGPSEPLQLISHMLANLCIQMILPDFLLEQLGIIFQLQEQF